MRIRGVFRPGDYPGDPAEAAELFGYLAPGVAAPEIDRPHSGLAALAHNPALATEFAKLSRLIAVGTGWCARADLREIAIQTLNLHFRSAFSFESRLGAWAAAGLGSELLAALPYARTSSLFDEEQRLVIAYTQAVVAGDVPAALFARVVERWGERGTMEFTALVGFWSCWAMVLNAVRPDEAPSGD